MNDKNYGLSQEVADHLRIPDRVSTRRIGELTFFDGVPTGDTAQKLFDEMDYVHAVDAYLNSLPLASQYGIRNGFVNAGIKDGDVALFSTLMDCNGVFLTANCDTTYFWSYLDLKNGPLVVETPKDVLGIFDDMWWHWIGDFGVPGPDRGEGGRFLIVPDDYQGALPEGGYFIYRCKTRRFSVAARSFVEAGDYAAVAKRIKDELKIYPYVPGGFGTSIGAFLEGKAPLAQLSTSKTPNFVEASGQTINTLYPGDFEYFRLVHQSIQEEHPASFDTETAGQLYALGIRKGQPFEPDERQKAILSEAAYVASGMVRASTYILNPADNFYYYGKDSLWSNSLFLGGYEFLTPPPSMGSDGVKQATYDGANKINARNCFFFTATVVTPAMIMRLTGLGSQYLVAGSTVDQTPLDGAKTYRVNLPKDVPAEKFWSLTVYDTQTRSLLQTEQRFPRAGSQDFPTPAAMANADGSTDVYFAPAKPANVAEGNWIQTVPNKSWFLMFRAYSPKRSFFDKSWKIGEIEEIK